MVSIVRHRLSGLISKCSGDGVHESLDYLAKELSVFPSLRSYLLFNDGGLCTAGGSSSRHLLRTGETDLRFIFAGLFC